MPWNVLDEILFHDWNQHERGEDRFDVDFLNSCTYKILTNQFRDPALNLDPPKIIPVNINWKKVFSRKPDEVNQHTFVAGFRKAPLCPKLSALTADQHLACLKVMCVQYPNVFIMELIQKPTNWDHKVFENVKETYLKEQKEFLEWAKKMWVSKHSSRALRPKPTTETVYEAEFKMRAISLQSFPKNFEMAAQISLNNKIQRCEMILKQDMTKVNIAGLPKVKYPQPISKKFMLPSCPDVPEPCKKHPCWFVLPNEKEMTVLPLTEVHRELAQYAVENGAQIIASESALKCLVENDRQWTISLSVCEVIGPDGDKRNVLVLGSEFSTNRKSAMERTYRAFRHLLEHAFLQNSEESSLDNNDGIQDATSGSQDEPIQDPFAADSDSDDEGVLVINDDVLDSPVGPTEPEHIQTTQDNNKKEKQNQESPSKKSKDQSVGELPGVYNCTCTSLPPARSYRLWQVRNCHNKQDKLDIIVHTSHKMREMNKEIITEPIVEYQLDLGATRLSPAKTRSTALSLLLRDNASLLNVRVDGMSGEVVTIDKITLEDMPFHVVPEITNTIYETLSQLQSLLPGHYILQHELHHGDNALLYATFVRGGGEKLQLDFNFSIPAEADEAKTVKTPPALTDVLLPIHRYRKTLPLAFTPNPKLVAQEPKKPPVKKAPPPPALRWPKRKGKGKKKKKRDTSV